MSVSYRELNRLQPASLTQASQKLSKAATKLATEHKQYKRVLWRSSRASATTRKTSPTCAGMQDEGPTQPGWRESMTSRSWMGSRARSV